mgnify:CR=1 FL=1
MNIMINFKSHVHKRDTGFTLMELIISMTILSLLATGTGFAIVRTLPDHHLQKAAQGLFLDFQLAKSTAVLFQEPVIVIFSTDNNMYTVTRTGSDGTVGGTGPAADTLVKEVSFENSSHGIVFGRGVAPPCPDCSPDAVTYPEKKTRFNINGSVNANGYVYLTHDNGDLCYRVGTPTMAGVVAMDKARNGIWENR